jgi:hypothetical protein
MEVPFPFTRPVIVVLSVMAGVVVGVDTVPANPFALTTDTLVTVPLPPPPPPDPFAAAVILPSASTVMSADV